MAASTLTLGLALLGGQAWAQQPQLMPYTVQPSQPMPITVQQPQSKPAQASVPQSMPITVQEPQPMPAPASVARPMPGETAVPELMPVTVQQPQPMPAEAAVVPQPMPGIGQRMPSGPATIEMVAMQKAPAGPATEEVLEYAIQLEPPGPQRLFRLEAEANLQKRMRLEAGRPGADPIEFPTYKPLTTEEFPGRSWAARSETAEPAYVCYGRLLFEDLNSERYGWDLGFVSPFVSAAYFYKDVVLLPYHLFSEPYFCCECSSGKCLPGDPVPYMIYPPQVSLTGAVAEAGTILMLAAIFP